MVICPHCGSYLDDKCLICPVCDYNFSSARKKEKREKIIHTAGKILKYAFIVWLILSIVTGFITVVVNGIFSGASALQGRVDRVFVGMDRLFSDDGGVSQRICAVGENLETAGGRLHAVHFETDEAERSLGRIRENAELSWERFSVFHIDTDRVTDRWLYAVNRGREQYIRIRELF